MKFEDLGDVGKKKGGGGKQEGGGDKNRIKVEAEL